MVQNFFNENIKKKERFNGSRFDCIKIDVQNSFNENITK